MNLPGTAVGGFLHLLKSSLSVSARCLSTSPTVCKGPGKDWRGPSLNTFHGGPWLCLFQPHDGSRAFYPRALARFKRLDWGQYVRPQGGRNKKMWKKTPDELWKKEQHIFGAAFHVRRLDRMFPPEAKMPRYIPDDPYKKYNDLPFHIYKWTKLKNAENIRLYGNNTYRYNRWKAHLSKHGTKYNSVEKLRYEPPGYHENIAANRGVYSPEFVPQDTPAPHFQRPPIRINKKMTDHRLKSVLNLKEQSPPLKSWDPLFKSMYAKF